MLELLLVSTMNTRALVNSTVLAQAVKTTTAQPAYQQPQDTKQRRQYRKPGGSRGCPHQLANVLTLVVPEGHVARTISPYPTFIWKLTQDVSLPLRFTLLEPGHKSLYSQEFDDLRSGLISLTLPKTVSPLEVGKQYRWSVSIICDLDKPSQNLFTMAWIERVAEDRRFSAHQNRKSCALTYARLGIWYDAIACAFATRNLISVNSLVERDIFSLLMEEVGLDSLQI